MPNTAFCNLLSFSFAAQLMTSNADIDGPSCGLKSDNTTVNGGVVFWLDVFAFILSPCQAYLYWIARGGVGYSAL
jgi:hypothetical protein